jgi:hypothetical protein
MQVPSEKRTRRFFIDALAAGFAGPALGCSDATPTAEGKRYPY